MTSPPQPRTRPTRRGSAGMWHRVESSSISLLLDPMPAAALDAVVAAVVAVRAASLPGISPIADLIADGDRVWLVPAEPAEPTLAEILARTGEDPPAAVGGAVLAQTARALLALHGAGVAHGAFGAETIIITEDGNAHLIEVGLASALAQRPASSTDDIRAWVRLAEIMRRDWSAGDATAAAAFGSAAAQAEAVGLAAAVAVLTAAGYEQGDVAALARMRATGAGAGDPVPAADNGKDVPPAPDVQHGHTLLPTAQPGPGGVHAATQLGARAAAARMSPGPGSSDSGTVGQTPVAHQSLRFGPGVPVISAERSLAGPSAQPAGAPTRRRRRRGRFIGTMITLAIAAGVIGFLWLRAGGAMTVTDVSVSTAAPPGQTCDITVDVIGAVRTEGAGGVLTYQWERNDGQVSPVLRETILPGDRETQVRLRWAFSGRGRYEASATLQVLGPDSYAVNTNFTYSCG